MNKRLVISLALAAAMVPLAAHAQAVGGGSAGFGQLVQWVLGQGVGFWVVAIAAALTGVRWMAGHRDVEGLVHFGIGATIFASALVIAGFFAAGGL